jgi:hypothetical protein
VNHHRALLFDRIASVFMGSWSTHSRHIAMRNVHLSIALIHLLCRSHFLFHSLLRAYICWCCNCSLSLSLHFSFTLCHISYAPTCAAGTHFWTRLSLTFSAMWG